MKLADLLVQEVYVGMLVKGHVLGEGVVSGIHGAVEKTTPGALPTFSKALITISYAGGNTAFPLSAMTTVECLTPPASALLRVSSSTPIT